MPALAVPPRRRLADPDARGRRSAMFSLLMVGVTVPASVLAWAIGTFLGLVVFDLEDQDVLSEAGTWGYVAGLGLVALLVAPGVAGIALGVRARRLGERRLGTAGVVVNAAVAAYLGLSSLVGLFFG